MPSVGVGFVRVQPNTDIGVVFYARQLIGEIFV
jgi:hypothetical protein